MSQTQPKDITVILPDGAKLSIPLGSTISNVAYEIGPGLGKAAVAGIINDELVDLYTPVSDNDQISIVTEKSDQYLTVLRHSAAHIFAQALSRLYPDVNLAIGPPIDTGFYYDFDGISITKENLPEIESEMKKIIKSDYEILRIDAPREEAEKFYSTNSFKLDILQNEAAESENVSFYTQDTWKDLCKGPHVSSTGKVKAIHLLDISAAYWRGDSDNQTLTRVYGTAFKSQSDLEEFLTLRELAKERDHRKLGQELDLFSIPEITGPGLPLFHPNGAYVLRELSSYVDSLNINSGYEPTETPHLFKTELWKQSGHYDNYQDDMFIFEVGDEEFGLKPMNCPGHATIFNQQKRSYRDLPVRYFENGKVYRKEQRGELSGLSRLWAFTIDDGHLFIRPDQIETEVNGVLNLILEVLKTFNLDFKIFLATRPEKYEGSLEIWEKAETQLKSVLDNSGLAYTVNDGDGAFYGPKIDFAFQDALGRSWDGPTVQLDFTMPERFDLSYVGADNTEHRPVMIHRALYGSYERFFMILIEHFNGKFPLWLAPQQIRILPITDDNLDYAQQIAAELSSFRVSIDDRAWTIGKKIRAAHNDRIPYMVILGEAEQKQNSISIRDRNQSEKSGVKLSDFITHLANEYQEKRIEPDFLQ
jgi:threonyl-tRNA synthetase